MLLYVSSGGCNAVQHLAFAVVRHFELNIKPFRLKIKRMLGIECLIFNFKQKESRDSLVSSRYFDICNSFALIHAF